MNRFPISLEAGKLCGEAIICDMVLPWGPRWIGVRDDTLERFVRSGFSFLSLTVGQDSIPSLEATIQHMAAERNRIAAVCLCRIRLRHRAREAGGQARAGLSSPGHQPPDE
jgi:hypothetical protein